MKNITTIKAKIQENFFQSASRGRLKAKEKISNQILRLNSSAGIHLLWQLGAKPPGLLTSDLKSETYDPRFSLNSGLIAAQPVNFPLVVAFGANLCYTNNSIF
ncbi:MAG: hypothetical protein H5U05_01690 [Candidatus Aminicenantes bacterium]|nr:hypothetical protein [Candidatus Aminicenantes bacterium]